MNPPITHYKDEVDETTKNLVNQELEREAKEVKAEEPVKLKELPVKKTDRKQGSSSSIVNAFRQKMANSTTSVSLPSAGKSVEFREISTAEQKEMSKIALQSNSRADLMYCAMLSLINKLAVDSDFNIRDYTEFERISVTLNLQQLNKINTEIKYTCTSCGKENTYRLDTPKLLRSFAKSYRADNTFDIESGGRKFTFVAGWPNVGAVEDFFKAYYRKYDNASNGVKESINNLSQVEYITMFLKQVTVSETSDPEDSVAADLEQMPYGERVQIIDCLPQSVVFDDDTGVVARVIEEFIAPMNKVFKYHDCAYCGAEQEGQVANLTDFLG